MLGEDEFSILMAPIVAACKDGDKMDEELAAVYYRYLKDLTPGAFQSAVDHWLATNDDRWMPSIGKLRELTLEYQCGRSMHWQEAWNKIVEASEVFSQQNRARSDLARQMVGDELMEYVRGMGGFLAIQAADGNRLAVLQSNFRSSYQQIEQQKIEQRKLPEGMRIPHKVIVQHVATKLGLPEPKDKKP